MTDKSPLTSYVAKTSVKAFVRKTRIGKRGALQTQKQEGPRDEQ